MAFFGVSPEKEEDLKEKMEELKISEDEIEETFIKSSGPGGQNVNKVSTCVRLHHIPTGIIVKCQKERSQALNRFLARRLLLKEIERQQKGFVEEEVKRIEKIRRQKRKRSQRAKEKMLADKKHKSEVKTSRKAIKPYAVDGGGVG